VSLESDQDVDVRGDRTAPGDSEPILATSALQDAFEREARVQIELAKAIEAEKQRRLAIVEGQIQKRLTEANRQAAERIQQSVATAADLMYNVRVEAERVAAELAATARADAERISRACLVDAERISEARLFLAERRAQKILEQARSAAATAAESAAAARTEEATVVPGRDHAAQGQPDQANQPDPLPSPDRSDDEVGAPVRQGRRRLPRVPKTVRMVLLVVVAVIGADLMRSFIVEPYTVASTSMEPQLHDGNRVVVDKLVYRLGDAGRGDVVVLDTDSISETTRKIGSTIVKRVIGLPGEVVEGVAGKVLINGEPLDEPWLHDVMTPSFGPVKVPDGSLFVLGDNRVVSIDSRAFGPVPAEAVVGRVDLVLWPLGDAGPL
jgi:signal peptidase I